MTRHMVNHLNYANDSSLEYRHPSRIPIAPPISPDRSFTLARSNPRTDPMARQPSRPGPTSNIPATNTASAPRRRIPVACGRCRKRKIRCSGDPGDTSGCNNCKQAGVGPGLCVFLRVQCEMRELVPDHVLISGGYEQVSSATVDLHPYSSSSSASSSSSSLQLGLPHPMHSTMTSQQLHGAHSMRVGGHLHGAHNNHGMPLKSLYHQDPMGGSSGGDCNAGLLLPGGMGHRSHYDGLGGDMTGGIVHGSSNNGISVNGDMFNGNYPQYMHPDISQGISNGSSALHGHHGHWTPLGGRQGSGLYMEQDQSGLSYIPNQNPGSYPMVFPALTSLSSSLPEGVSKVQLPLPIRTQASEISSANSRPSTTGTALASETIASGYSNQSTQVSPYRGYSTWGGDSSFTQTSQASSAQQAGIPALPMPTLAHPYNSHNGPIFTLASSNSSLLPGTPHTVPSIQSSQIDPFSTQSPPNPQHQKHHGSSESSSGSKVVGTPTQTMGNHSVSNSSYSPPYSRSSNMNSHGAQSPQHRRNFSKVY